MRLRPQPNPVSPYLEGLVQEGLLHVLDKVNRY